MSNTQRKIAWDKIFSEFALKGIDYKICDNYDIEFLEEQYDLGVSIIGKHLGEFVISDNLN